MGTPGVLLGSLLVLAGAVVPASAQLVAARNAPVVYGHHHLTVTNVEAHKTFWIEALGGIPERKRHCSLLGVQALHAAIEDWERKGRGDLKGGALP